LNNEIHLNIPHKFIQKIYHYDQKIIFILMIPIIKEKIIYPKLDEIIVN